MSDHEYDLSGIEPTNAEDIRHLAEAALFQAQAREAEAKARAAELVTAKAEREAAAAAADNSRNHVYHFETSVRDTQTARETFDRWHRLNPDAPWTIIMNSPGGSVIDGMALFDHLVAHSLRGGGTHHITIIVRGFAASMGGILLQAADTRVAGPEAYVLIHKVQSGAMGSLDELEDQVKLLKMMCARVEDIFVKRAGGKLSKAMLRRNWGRRDWWLDSKTALKLGVVDAIG
jgi:ATP-dependent protease ClpP protease subunit